MVRLPGRDVGATEALHGRRLSAHLLRFVPEPDRDLVLDVGVRQPAEGAQLPGAAAEGSPGAFVETTETISGGRFSIDGWMNGRDLHAEISYKTQSKGCG